jgi:hypothetical protein
MTFSVVRELLEEERSRPEALTAAGANELSLVKLRSNRQVVPVEQRLLMADVPQDTFYRGIAPQPHHLERRAVRMRHRVWAGASGSEHWNVPLSNELTD